MERVLPSERDLFLTHLSVADWRAYKRLCDALRVRFGEDAARAIELAALAPCISEPGRVAEVLYALKQELHR